MSPSEAGWRGGSDGGHRNPGEAEKADPLWRRDKAPHGKSNYRLLRRFGMGLFGFLLLGVITYGLYVLFMTEPAFRTAVAVVQSKSEWNGEELAKILEVNTTKQRFTPSDTLDFARHDAALVLCTAIARTGERGTVILKPEDPDSGGQPLSEFLAEFNQLTRPTVLLLDLGLVRNDWRRGILGTHFVRDLKKATIPKNLIILTSCDDGEKSWRSRHLGGKTVFSYFAVAGIGGLADAKPYGDGNSRVTADEFIRYVQKKTTSWVFRNREATPGQHPQSFTSVSSLSSIVLARVADSAQVAAKLPGKNPVADTSTLTSRWTQLAEISPKQATQSLKWQQLAAVLCRAERSQLEGQPDGSSSSFDEQIQNSQTILNEILKPLETEERPEPFQIAELLIGGTRWFEDHEIRSLADTVETYAKPVAEESFQLRDDQAGLIRFLGDSFATADADAWNFCDQAFSGEPGTPEELRDRRKALLYRYTKLDADAALLNSSREILRMSLAKLPSMATWAANSSPPTEANDVYDNINLVWNATTQQDSDRALDKLKFSDNSYTHVLHAVVLTRWLRSAFESETSTLSQIVEIANQLNSEIDAFESLQFKLAKEFNKEQAEADDLQRGRNWLNLIALPADVRADVLKNCMRYQDSLSQKSEQSEDSTPPVGSDVTALRDSHIRWEAFWLINRLLMTRVERSSTVGDERESDFQVLIDNWDPSDSRRLADRIGDCSRRLWDRSVKLSQKSKISSTDSDLESTLQRLRRADHIARQIIAVQPEAQYPTFDIVEVQRDRDPVKTLREAEDGEFALYVANKLRRSRWQHASTELDKEGATKQAGKWLELAGRLGMAPFKQYLAAKVYVDSKPSLTILVPDRVAFLRGVDEVDVNCDITGPEYHADQKAQTPVIWMIDSDDATRPSVSVSNNGLIVPFVPTEAKVGAKPKTLSQESASVALLNQQPCVDGQLRATCFLRGLIASTPLNIEACTSSAIETVIEPLPPTGKILVDAPARRGIVFVLDWSVSMNEPKNNPRYQIAVRTLRDIIKGLDDNEEVGIVIFGRRHQGTTSVETLVPLGRNSRINAIQALSALENTDRKGNTPLLRSLMKAIDVAKVLDSGGAVVAITDGAPTDVRGQGAEFKQKFLATQHIPVKMILFGVDDGPRDPEEQAKWTAFADYQDNVLGRRIESVKATNDAKQLTAKLQAMIPTRAFTVENTSGFRKEFAFDESANGLEPGRYQITTGESVLKNIEIAGGEFHRFNTDDVGKLVRSITNPNVNDIDPDGEVAAGEPTGLNVSGFFIDENRTATLEISLFNGDKGAPMVWPKLMDISVRPDPGPSGESLRRGALTMTLVPSRVVPTWTVKVADWPTDNPDALISAKWSTKGFLPTQTVAIPSAQRLRLDELSDLTVTVKTEPRLTLTVKKSGPFTPDDVAALMALDIRSGTFTQSVFVEIPCRRTIRKWPDNAEIEFQFGDPTGKREPTHFAIGSNARLSVSVPEFSERPDDVKPSTSGGK